MSTSNSTSPPSSGNPFLQSYQAWSIRTPLITRSSTVILTIVYILTWFINLQSWWANIPYYTIFYFEIYRLLLSPLVGNSLLTLILAYLVYPSLGVKMESSMGSSAFLYLILFFTLTVNIGFALLCLFAYLLGSSSALGWVSMDFWTLLFALITLDCMQTPDMPRRLMFIPVDIPSKYIPLILYVLICLFSGFVLSYALSLLMGYLWMRGTLDRFRPSSIYLEQLESEGGWLRYPSRASGWVLAGTLGHDAWIPVNTVDPSEHGHPSSQPTSNAGASNSGGFFGSGRASDAQQGNPMHDSQNAFPGSGRKLTESGSSSTATAGGGFFSSLPIASVAYSGTVARPPSGALPVASVVSTNTTNVQHPSREEVAARRLAALEAQQRGYGNMTSAGGSSSSSVVGTVAHAAITTPSAPPLPPHPHNNV